MGAMTPFLALRVALEKASLTLLQWVRNFVECVSFAGPVISRKKKEREEEKEVGERGRRRRRERTWVFKSKTLIFKFKTFTFFPLSHTKWSVHAMLSIHTMGLPY